MINMKASSELSFSVNMLSAVYIFILLLSALKVRSGGSWLCYVRAYLHGSTFNHNMPWSLANFTNIR